MRGYKVIKEGMFHVVYETANELKLRSFKGKDSEQRAKDLARHLNLGGGFDGYTPNFFREITSSYGLSV